MNNLLQFYPDPGIAYDITKMLFVKLHPENIWKPLLTTLENTSEDVAYIQERSKLFVDPPQELLLFSHLFNPKNQMFLTNTVTKLITADFKHFSISQLLSYFDNITQVKHDLYTFYFDEISSDYALEHTIRTNNSLPDKIKVYLFGFHLNPAYYISKLKEAIIKYKQICESIIVSKPNEIISSDFLNWLLQTRNVILSNNDSITIAYSLCVTIPYFFADDMHDISPYFISTPQEIQNICNFHFPPSIDALAKTLSALGDKRRIAILNLLIQHNSLSLKEIASALQLSDTATYHHIVELKQSRLITSSRQDRQIMYSFSSNEINDIITALIKLSRKEPL